MIYEEEPDEEEEEIHIEDLEQAPPKIEDNKHCGRAKDYLHKLSLIH